RWQTFHNVARVGQRAQSSRIEAAATCADRAAGNPINLGGTCEAVARKEIGSWVCGCCSRLRKTGADRQYAQRSSQPKYKSPRHFHPPILGLRVCFGSKSGLIELACSNSGRLLCLGVDRRFARLCPASGGRRGQNLALCPSPRAKPGLERQ